MALKNKILDHIKSDPDLWVFTSKDFVNIGSQYEVQIALYDLYKNGDIFEITEDVYYVSKEEEWGIDYPYSYYVNKTISRRDNITIIGTPEFYDHYFGLSDKRQVKGIFLTNGPSQVINKHGKKWLEINQANDDQIDWITRPCGPVVILLLSYENKDFDKNEIGNTLKKNVEEELKMDLARHYDSLPEWMKPIVDIVIDK